MPGCEDESVTTPLDPDFGRALESLATTDPRALGLPYATGATARLIGQGETYAVWRLDVGDADPAGDARLQSAADGARTDETALVVRVAARSDAAPRPAAAEFAALQLAPVGLGPRPVALTPADGNATGHALLVEGFVPGRVLPPSGWTDDLLRLHARQLASLHAARYPACRSLLDDADVGSPVMDPVAQFDAAVEYWRGTRPDLLDLGGPTKLLEPLREYVAAARPAFDGMSFALVHGDAALPNILVDQPANGAARLTYIDWEWSEIGDPARDLGLLGAPRGASPWYLTLDDQRETMLLESYVEAGGGRDGDDVDRLRTRRRAHEVMEQFFTAIHFLGRLDLHPPEGAPPVGSAPLGARQRPVYENAVRNMLLSVQARLLSAQD